ncbi:MAG: tRNA (guanosine(37)-N1)-methyltransferase TrmD [SAR86 cluster bacterium]|nr:tRNA (guanosine(37)-N1)-methyltransferase TrmD [SAR86 cluster bacterium]
MRFDVVTLFPEVISKAVSFGVTGKAFERGIATLNTWNPRDYADNSSRRIDDKPYSGGPGMLMQVGPVMKTIEAIKTDSLKPTHVIYLTPQGKPLKQNRVKELSSLPSITLLSGRYEGIDQRILDKGVDEEISIGDYIVSGGEFPALILMDSIVRLLDGVLGEKDSINDESFENNLLEYPQYTRPENSPYGKVPSILLGGNTNSIDRWKLKQSLIKTLSKRPDLMQDKELTSLEKELFDEIKDEDKT